MDAVDVTVILGFKLCDNLLFGKWLDLIRGIPLVFDRVWRREWVWAINTIAEMLKKSAKIEVKMKRPSMIDWYGSCTASNDSTRSNDWLPNNELCVSIWISVPFGNKTEMSDDGDNDIESDDDKVDKDDDDDDEEDEEEEEEDDEEDDEEEAAGNGLLLLLNGSIDSVS